MLQSLADLFRTFFRATDKCWRYVAEEFAIIPRESSSHDAVMRADELRSEVKTSGRSWAAYDLGWCSCVS